MSKGTAAQSGDGSHELRRKTITPTCITDQDTVNGHAPRVGGGDLPKDLVADRLLLCTAIEPGEWTARRRAIADQDDGLEPCLGTVQHLKRLRY
tara:strand:+ start:461 stop:742 length:282 start_codon:yes stop_codon:yes gene_type:complete